MLAIALSTIVLATQLSAQDQNQDDPPGRVARLGYLQGSVSFQPAGETDWVQAVTNRPMTTGDQLWTDRDSRAEVQLGSAVIRLAANTGFSFLNLDDYTTQIQLTSGAISINVRRLADNEAFEVDTPNQAFTVLRPGHYRVEASADGNSTVVSVRLGEGEATGNGETFPLDEGQRGTFTGTDSLHAEVVDIGDPDDFDQWNYDRDRRYDFSPSTQYLSRDVVGYEDLHSYGEWRNDFNYGHVWYPTQVGFGWAPYHDGHWAWIAPWGWTWVDDSPWGYAPFHYGRWAFVEGRWGWVPGPVAVQAVYAPALVVFVGGGMGVGGNVGWFPLGPREVYVPSYQVSAAYMNRVNISNTTVNVTTVTNVYNTTIINRTTNITNVTYVNRNVAGAVTAVPQQAFVSAQPVAKAAVTMNARDIAAAPMSARAAVVPTRASVLGSNAGTANHVATPPPAVANRQVVAKKLPPPPPVPFAKQQQALAAHPGQPLARSEVQSLRPANAAATRPMVRQAPPAKSAAPNAGRMGNPATRTMPPQQTGRPEMTAPENRPETNRPPTTSPVHSQPNQPETSRPAPPPQPNRNEPAARPQTPPPSQRSEQRPEQRTPPPAATKPAPRPPHEQQKPQTPAQKKQEGEQQKKEQQKPPGE
ncbi:MAG: DUF6600 domain-containing protein [Terriglobales bacterium]